jgi:DNA invertase Pin-like site-specific DNA recombinase
MRFAFYGRVSTEDQQEPESSRNWQLARSRQLIEPAGGEIVEEFFDIGQSRSLPWKRRPEASRLLGTFSDPTRGFDGVVIGEPQRAFYGNQFGLTFPVFVHYGVGLWVPEVGGAVDPGSDAHDLVMSLYGGMSKGERNRIKTRVRSAMAAQAAIEGRFLGGRPPYGYQLVDAGPHPNPAKAAAGQQLRRLESDPKAAPVAQRIFAEFLAGRGLYAIAEGLTADGILSPSAHDPDRNRHRSSSRGAWSKSAVRAILRNPRYTGYQVWNRQARHDTLIDVNDVALGHDTKMRWNDRDQWIWSEQQTHEPLITVEQFEGVRRIFRGASRSAVRREKTKRGPYILSGMMRCGVCGRRMQGSWNHDQPYYRCKFPAEYAIAEQRHPKTIYIKEAAITPTIDQWLAQLFDDDHIDDTCAALEAATASKSDDDSHLLAARRTLKTCDSKLAKYRQALEAGTDASIVSGWIEEVKLERKAAELQLRREHPTLSKDDIRSLVLQSKGIVEILAQADPEDRRAVYQELGVSIIYHRNGRLHVSAGPSSCTNDGVGGGT